MSQTHANRKTFIGRNPSVLYFIAALAMFTVIVTVMSEATGAGLISTSFVKTLGKTLCLCLVAIARRPKPCRPSHTANPRGNIKRHW